MEKTITVRGMGKVKKAPDLIVIQFSVEAKDMDYSRAVDGASEQIDRLNSAFLAAGFDEGSLKTLSFQVRADYEGYSDEHGMYRQRFVGYVCRHPMKLEFAYDTQRLADALAAVAASETAPELNIMFTVKDRDAIERELLADAAKHAREKAEVLCRASGAQLGSLVSIDYNWSELVVRSNTTMDCAAYGAAPARAKMSFADINPEDVEVGDSAVFVWEIFS